MKIQTRYYVVKLKNGLLLYPKDWNDMDANDFYSSSYSTKEEIEKQIIESKAENIIILETKSYDYMGE
jgi:hypothetical protein